MAPPPMLVAAGFFVAVGMALALMAYIAWRGSKPSSFFVDAVKTTYELDLSLAEIDAYYDLKDKIQEQFAPSRAEAAGDPDEGPPEEPWVRSVPPEKIGELQRALMRRLVSCIDKLDQVQRDKPGNWKLWRGKLVSERYWGSLCDAERRVSEEIDSCTAEADELKPGWREHIFNQAVNCWRMQKQQEVEKQMQKKAVESEKKKKEKEVRRKEVEERLKEEEKKLQELKAEKAMEKLLREEEKAAAAKQKAKGKEAPKSKGKKK